MRLSKVLVLIVILFLGCSWIVCAQDNLDREVVINKNVKLFITGAHSEIPAGIAGQYSAFLPLLEAVLKENVSSQSDNCELTIKVAPIVKEIGSAKTKRAAAKITAYRKNAKQEFIGTLILYSYINSGPVTKEETQHFLQKQILDPCECSK